MVKQSVSPALKDSDYTLLLAHHKINDLGIDYCSCQSNLQWNQLGFLPAPVLWWKVISISHFSSKGEIVKRSSFEDSTMSVVLFVHLLGACIGWWKNNYGSLILFTLLFWILSYVIDQRHEAGFPSSHIESWAKPGSELHSFMSHATDLSPTLFPCLHSLPPPRFVFASPLWCVCTHTGLIAWDGFQQIWVQQPKKKKKKRPFSESPNYSVGIFIHFLA